MATPGPSDITPPPGSDVLETGFSDAGFGGMWEHATIGLFRSSPDGRIFRANPALLRLAGCISESELQGATLPDLAPDWYAAPARRAEFRRLMAEHGSLSDFRSRLRRVDTGDVIWVTENAWVVRDAAGSPLYHEGTVTDITDCVASRESLKRREDCLDTACDWYWETDADHRFTHLSDGARKHGIDPAARIGHARIDVAEDPATPEWLELRARIEARQPFRDVVYQTRNDQGAELYLSVSGKPVFDPGGRFLGYRGSTREVNEQIHAREQIRNAWRRSEEANRAKSEFLANMSHELRTPLNAIIGFAEAMRDGVVPAKKSSLYARYIQESGEHLLYLINDILDMSKIAAGRLALEMEAVDASELIARSTAMFELRAEQGGVTLDQDVEPGLPPLHGDRVRLGQILVNLISNAIKFTDAGGRVSVRCRRHDEAHAVIEVADTGIGMAPEELVTAMEPFGQVKRGGDGRRHEGTGLGLPIVRSLVDLHGGRMTVDTARDQGTRVEFVLPLHAKAQTEDAHS